MNSESFLNISQWLVIVGGLALLLAVIVGIIFAFIYGRSVERSGWIGLMEENKMISSSKVDEALEKKLISADDARRDEIIEHFKYQPVEQPRRRKKK